MDMDILLALDKKIFIFLNQKLTHGFLDVFFPYITGFHKTWEFKILFILFFALWFYLHRKRAFFFLGGLLLTVGLSDLVSSHFLKPFWGRTRPSQSPYKEELQTRVRLPFSPGNASFPSSHAVNISSTVTFLVLMYPSTLLAAGTYTLCFLVGYSRIYVGVHFPGDVLAGFLLGPLLGWLVWWILFRFSKQFVKRFAKRVPKQFVNSQKKLSGIEEETV